VAPARYNRGDADSRLAVAHRVEESAVTSTELIVAQRWSGSIHLAGDDATPPLEVVIIRDEAAYHAFVARLPEKRVQMKQPAPPSDDPMRARPAIDFGVDMLVVVVRGDTLGPPTIARVNAAAGQVVIHYVAPPPPPEARPHGIGGYAAVQVPRTDGVAVLTPPRVITDRAELAGAVGELVTLRGALSRTRIPTILGVDVEASSAGHEQPAEATGWLEREVVTQAEIDARVASSGQYANRGAGTFHRLVAPDGAGLATARRR
jgi:hypothetical protein